MIYSSLLRPLLFRLPPESAHHLALRLLSFAPEITKRLAGKHESLFGNLRRFGLDFRNPVGLAAGFDKDGIALRSLSALGFGFIEAGTVTTHAQPGNQKPRLFRLPLDRALINRAGFNNGGAKAFVNRVARQPPDCVLGVSIGKSRIVPVDEAVKDYLECFETVFPVADYIAINISSPNTPGLRDLQQPKQLQELLSALQKRNRELSVDGQAERPLLVKISPDIKNEDLGAIVEVVKSANVSGIIATNTTVAREGLKTSPESIAGCGAGGLSGAPLRQPSNAIIAALFRLSSGTLPIIGVGGIFNADDAWEKICAGSSLVQLYTGFIYEGPCIANRINEGLYRRMLREGFQTLDEAVGSRAKELTNQ
jgi:dihydroorotate dehydrogenase